MGAQSRIRTSKAFSRAYWFTYRSAETSSMPGKIASSSASTSSTPVTARSVVMYPEMSFQWRPISSVTSTSWIQRLSATGDGRPVRVVRERDVAVERVREGVGRVHGHDERLQAARRERQARRRGDRRLADAALAREEEDPHPAAMLRGRDAPLPGRERDPREEEGRVAVDRVVPAAHDRR